MYGHKQILSCLAVVILVSIFNFYRSAIKRNKEHLLWKAEQRLQDELLLMQQLELDRHVELNRQMKQKQEAVRAGFLARWLEYENRCCDLHALIFRPREYSKWARSPISTQEPRSVIENLADRKLGAKTKTIPALSIENPQHSCEYTNNKVPTPKTPPEHVQDKVAGDLSTKIIYVAVFVLLLSLGKAAYDWSKQFKELRQTKTLSEDEVLRRCSLQAYSLIKHKQGQQACKATALEPFLKKTKATGGASLRPQLSLDSGADQTHEQHREFVRRISTNPQDYRNGSGLTSPEPGTPVKPGKLLAGRPVPLLRRCSVPVFVNQNTGSSRRPSMDSFSEDDSTAPHEVKRRIRMIHRH